MIGRTDRDQLRHGSAPVCKIGRYLGGPDLLLLARLCLSEPDVRAQFEPARLQSQRLQVCRLWLSHFVEMVLPTLAVDGLCERTAFLFCSQIIVQYVNLWRSGPLFSNFYFVSVQRDSARPFTSSQPSAFSKSKVALFTTASRWLKRNIRSYKTHDGHFDTGSDK